MCAPEALAEAERALLADGTHVLVTGPRGAGKSHCVEVLARRLSERHGWRAVWLQSVGHLVLGVEELLAAIVERDLGIRQPWAAETPALEESVARLTERRRDTGAPLVVVLEDLPLLSARSLRGAELRRFVSAVEQASLVLLATATSTRLGRRARPLLSLFREISLEMLSPAQIAQLIAAHAAHAGDSVPGAAMDCVRAIGPLLGGNPRLVAALYQIARRYPEGDLVGPLSELVDRVADLYRAQLHALSPQQGLVLSRLALAPGPTAAARLGRQCDLPTSHITAIMDVLLQRILIERVPGPGKRKLYAVADRWLRRHLCLEERRSTFARTVALARFFAQGHERRARRADFEAQRATHAQLLRELMAPSLGDIRSAIGAAIRALALALEAEERDSGNRLLVALLDRPSTGGRAANTALSEPVPTREAEASGPERAVSHLARAAQFLHAGELAPAADELASAHGLAPNWLDLRLTEWLVRFADGDIRPLVRAGEAHGAQAILDAVARFFCAPDDASDAVRHLGDRAVAGDMALWSALAAVAPPGSGVRDRTVSFLAEVGRGAGVDAGFLGQACAIAFARGRWSLALEFLQARDRRQSIAAELWPSWAWLAARAGDVAGFAAVAARLRDHSLRPAWLLSGLAVALLSCREPASARSHLAVLFGEREPTSEEREQLFAGLWLVSDQVEPSWLVAASGLFAEVAGPEPEPLQWFRDYVASGQDERHLRTLHPEMREAIGLLTEGDDRGVSPSTGQ